MTLKFIKRKLDDVKYEAAAVFDVNNNGILDIACGEYWYEGPDFKTKHKMCDVQPVDDYFDDFSDFPMDVNGNGYMDIITGGWWGETLRWRKNPGAEGGEWKVIDIDKCGSIETTRFVDLDGDGHLEIVPNTPGAPQAYYKLILDDQGKGTGQFRKIVISDRPSGHGLGYGDINGNGLVDIILDGGWLEQPEDPENTLWTFHPEFQLGGASVPILTHDVNGDGLMDLIVGKAHDYGLDWYEQHLNEDGTRNWIKHEIDPHNSQYHDLWLVDIDLDGELELITGKRFRAHAWADPGSKDPLGLYYFKINGGKFEKHIIDYGPAGEASGAGIYFWVQDISGNGYPDIVAPGKDGLYLFTNTGEEDEFK